MRNGRLLIVILAVVGWMTVVLPLAAQKNGDKGTTVAETMIDTLSANDQRRYEYFFLEAIREQERGNYANAFSLLQHCRDINPDAAEVYFAMSSYYVEMENDTMLIQCMERAAALAPNNDNYLERLGQTYLKARDYDKAIDVYERLASHNLHRTDVLEVLQQLYHFKKDYNNLISTLDRIEIIEGNSEETALAKMQIYSMQGKKNEEYKVLRDLVKKHPYDLNYRVMTGNWLLQNDRAKEALNEYRYVLKQEPDNQAVQFSLLDYYKAQGQEKAAQQLRDHLLMSDKTDSENKILLIRQLINENEQAGGDSTEVLRMFERLLQQPKPDADIAELRAAYMDLKKMPRDSINAALERVLQIAPDNAGARLHLIQSIWRTEDYDSVIRLCRPALEYNPDEMAFYYYLGLAHYQKDERDEALDAFRRGVGQINSESNRDIVSDFYSIMGDILHQKGLDQEAFAAYDSCLHWNPENIPCLNNYAYYLSERGQDLVKAEQMSFRTIKAQPDNGTYLDTYAWILFMQGRFEEAKIYIDQALKNDKDPGGVVIEHAGDIYANIGDLDRAIDYWQQAIKAGGGSNLLEQKVGQRKYIK